MAIARKHGQRVSKSRTVTVTAVARDVWAVRIPLRGRLDHVFAYLLETRDGTVLVDTGPGSALAERALSHALTAINSAFPRVSGVLATHAHPDHYGLAGRIRELSRGWVALHAADVELAMAGCARAEDVAAYEMQWLTLLGVPPALRPALVEARVSWNEQASATDADLVLTDGDRAPVPGWDLTVLHTPGHTPGHVCFHDRRRGLIFVGDHILHRISPSIGLYTETGNPLRSYLRSLAEVGKLGDVLVLPGHGIAMTSLATRADEIRAHHERRLDIIESLVAAGTTSVWSVAKRIPWAIPWTRVEGLMRSAALGETHAHLVELEARGRIGRGMDADCLTYFRRRRHDGSHNHIY